MRRLRDFGIVGVLLVAPALLAFGQYLIVQREAGLRRTLDTWIFRPSSFLASPSHVHQWVLSWFPNAQINETADAYLFPGFVPTSPGVVRVHPAAIIRVRLKPTCESDAGTGASTTRESLYALLTRVQRVADSRPVDRSLAVRLLVAGIQFHPRAVALHAAGDSRAGHPGGVRR